MSAKVNRPRKTRYRGRNLYKFFAAVSAVWVFTQARPKVALPEDHSQAFIRGSRVNSTSQRELVNAKPKVASGHVDVRQLRLSACFSTPVRFRTPAVAGSSKP
jgi:hypothetical protein